MQLREALKPPAVSQQILIPLPIIDARGGTIRKTPMSDTALIQQSLRDVGFKPLGNSIETAAQSNTISSSDGTTAAPPLRDEMQSSNPLSFRQMLNFPAVSQSSPATTLTTRNIPASPHTNVRCTSSASLHTNVRCTSSASLPRLQTSVQFVPASMQHTVQPNTQYSAAPVQQFTPMYMQPANSMTQSQWQYSLPPTQPITQASGMQQTPLPTQVPRHFSPTATSVPAKSMTATQIVALRKLDKMPEFYKHSPQLWINLLESQFAAAEVTSPIDKYYHLATKLGHDVTAELKHSLLTLPAGNEYDSLKSVLVRKYVENDTSKLKRLGESLNGPQNCSPSKYLMRLASAADKWMQREAILEIWKKNIHPSISNGLSSVITPENEAENIRRADELYDTFNFKPQPQPAYNLQLAPIQPSSQANSDKTFDLSKIAETLSKLEAKMTSLEKKLDKPRNNNNSSSNKKYDRSSSSSRQQKKETQETRDTEGMCYYHRRYAEEAKKCVDPCILSHLVPKKPNNAKN
uniref:DUF7041 domain-containing protein n=1 Tax=Trichogramma kaykai TaxID=54128 RepID=A0ABD2W5M6_9HYME